MPSAHSAHPLVQDIPLLLQKNLAEFVFYLMQSGHTQAAESIHQARTGWRKFQSIRRFLQPRLNNMDRVQDPYLKNIRWLMGELRNLDVSIDILSQIDRQDLRFDEYRPHHQSFMKSVMATRKAQQQELKKALSTPTALQAIGQLCQPIPPVRFNASNFPRWAAHRLDRMNKRRRELARKATTDDCMHQHRLLAKDIRYVLETFPFLLKKKRFSRLLHKVQRLQKSIGHARDLKLTLDLLKKINEGQRISETYQPLKIHPNKPA